jgi:hypothetical protein
VTELYYWIDLSSPIGQSFTIDQKEWNGATLVGESIITYDGSGTIIPVGGSVPGYPDIVVLDHPYNNDGFGETDLAVPDGGSPLMLLGSSLAGLALLRRRFGRC